MKAEPISGQFEDVSLQGREIVLDGSSFLRCRFEKCSLVYGGGALPVLSGCRFDDCSWSFAGAAANTVGFLSGLHNGGFEDLIEATFQQIRKGAMISRVETGGTGEDKWHGAKPVFGLPGPRVFKLPRQK
jgi:hypothetical protein